MSTEGRQEQVGSASRAGRPATVNQQETNEQSGRKYFLGIAIDEYIHWPKLRNARRDVRAVSRLLCDVYGFQEDDMTFLENDGATTENIINSLHELVHNVGNTDSLIIYYAGHGHFEDRTQRGYWVPVDARNREIADYIQNSVIKDYLKDIPSLHTLLLSDACFSGSLFVRGHQRDGLLTAKELLQLQSRWALCSGRHNETVADGPPDGHSPFAESILDVLGKSDREYITLDFLLEQVREQTRANYSQLPDGGPLQFADHKRGQFVFMRQTARQLVDPKVLVHPDPIPKTEEPPLAEHYVDEFAGTFVLVEGGSFDMGCTLGQQDCYDNEKPVHRVTLSSYFIGRYEVTQAQWRELMGDNPSKNTGCDQCPVEQVSWEDIQEFLRRLNARTGQYYRLPTEAEWEFAARGGNKGRGYPYAGSTNLGDVAWYRENAGGKTHPVGQQSPNELGLYDMSGNVYEWCEDWFGTYSPSTQSNPAGPSTGSSRVYRGGSWYLSPRHCRVAFRNARGPGDRAVDLGFRLARDA